MIGTSIVCLLHAIGNGALKFSAIFSTCESDTHVNVI